MLVPSMSFFYTPQAMFGEGFSYSPNASFSEEFPLHSSSWF